MSAHVLKQRQSLPLAQKVMMAKRRIREFYGAMNGDVYVAFSGGKDSTVLLDLVRQCYPDVPAVFADTGLEYPEVRAFVKTFDNVEWVKPEMSFRRVLEEYGYPVVSKAVSRYVSDMRVQGSRNANTKHLRMTGMTADGRFLRSMMLPYKWRFLVDAPFKISAKCCDFMKKRPIGGYVKRTGCSPIMGTMASDSSQRQRQYVRAGGCNVISAGKAKSAPLSAWLEEDIWQYIRERSLPYCSIYDTGVKRTGCMFCMFGVHLEKEPNRFQRMKKTHPKLWSYCADKLGLRDVLAYLKVPCGDENER